MTLRVTFESPWSLSHFWITLVVLGRGGRQLQKPITSRSEDPISLARKRAHRLTIWVRRLPGGWGSCRPRGVGPKVLCLPRRFLYWCLEGRVPGMCREFCRNVPLDCWVRNGKSAHEGNSVPEVPADIRPKTSVRPSKSWKSKHCSTGIPRGRP